MPFVADTRAADVAESIRATLAAAVVGVTPVFASVGVYDDLDSFIAKADVLQNSPIAGVIAGPPDRRKGDDNGEDFVMRVPLDVAVRFRTELRNPGEAEKSGTVEAQRLSDLVRQIVRADPLRGGKAARIMWAGDFLDGTDVTGLPRMLARGPDQAFYTAVIPVTVGLETDTG
jgi:hypothetical protein